MKEENVKKVKKNKTAKKAKRTIVVILFSIVCLIVSYVMYRGNYLEILEIGKNYIGSFYDSIKYRAITILVSFIWIFILMYTTNRRIKKGLKIFFTEENKEMPKFPNKSISFITAAIVSVITSNIFLQKTILFINNTSFGRTDFIYGHDIGYYLFIKPFLQAILVYMLVTLIAVTLYAAIYYIILLNTQFTNGVSLETLKKSVLKKQLLNNVKVIVIMLAVLTLINAEDLATQTFLTVGENESAYSISGAGTSDITIKVWGYRILSILMVLAIFLGISAYNKKKNRGVVLWILSVPTYLIGLIIILIGYNKLFIDSNEYEKEKQYIAYNIENTRDAYGLNVEEIKLEDSETINSEEITQYSEVVNNISTTNKSLVLKSLNGTLTSKGYYKYTSSNAGIYNIDGKNTLVYITPREIVSNENAYTNATYEYTHGYGAVVTSASQTNSSGDLINLQKDFSNENNVININNPRLYFGLETNNTIVTNSKNKNEFDYPSNESNDSYNATNSYDGKAGLKLNTLDRMILALSNGDVNLAFSTNINENSKILTNRNIIERAKKVMPYLTYDSSPYLVVTDDGNLVWVIDAYTTSKYYPYSQKSNVNGQEINYIKNSVKVLVDAYDGDIKFYITDRTDLIVMAYKKAFPDVFMDLDAEIPKEISKHFTYSEFLYNIQAEILKRYHNTETDVLYRANDVWDIAKYGTGINSSTTETTQMTPYYAMVKTIDSKESKIGLVLPYTIYGKQSITAYAVGTYEDGKMQIKLYRYPSDNYVLGPMQLDTQISQNEAISKEIESLDVSGTKLTKNIVVVPIDNKLIYVESIYQEYINESDSLPKLKKVVVASGNKIAIGNDLKTALNNLVSQGVNIEVENPENEAELIKSIIKANKDLKESTANSDYEIMGKDIKQLQTLIDKLEELQNKESNKNKENNNENSNGLTISL